MAFIRNGWYMAAWSDDLPAGQLVPKILLNDPVVLYRKLDGGAVALSDMCIHRYAPLALGKVCGDLVRCGYHGLEFNSDGKCVRNPHGSGRIPPKAEVRSYPIEERQSIIWIWMGDKALADREKVPDCPMLDPASDVPVLGRNYIKMDVSYELIIANLLDLSHTAFLHDGILGSEETALAAVTVRQSDDGLIVNREVSDVPAPVFFDLLFRRDGKNVDLWAEIIWRPPGSLVNDAGVKGVAAARSEGTGALGTHFITPETERTTHYHYAAARFNPITWGGETDREVTDQARELQRFAFEEQDKIMLEQQQQRMSMMAGRLPQNIGLEVDAGVFRFERMLKKMLRDEERPSVPTEKSKAA